MSNFKYMDSNSVISDLSRNSSVGKSWFKKARFQFFRDVDFVCEYACRSDYHNLKHCSKEIKDNPSVVLAAMFMCHDKYEQELALRFASERLQVRVKEVVAKKGISIEEALYALKIAEAKTTRFEALTKQD